MQFPAIEKPRPSHFLLTSAHLWSTQRAGREERTVPEANKAKTARRVIEVLEYFDEQNPHATVMDIVRRYKRPQSSTSELLASLVEMGILYKDAASRSYTPTPRAALLGS